jgi:hypothetical protein
MAMIDPKKKIIKDDISKEKDPPKKDPPKNQHGTRHG